MTARTFYVLDLGLCRASEWATECVEWTGTSIEDVARDCAAFWGQDEDIADGAVIEVLAASTRTGEDARRFKYRKHVDVRFTFEQVGEPARVDIEVTP